MKKENKKAITIRIDQEILENYNETLKAIYGKKQRKKSTTIETILKQFNNQDINTLQKYMYNDKPLINLNLEQIQEYQEKLQKLQDENKSLKETIAEKDKFIESFKALDNKEIASLKNTIAEKDKIIEQYKIDSQNQEKDIDAIRKANNEKDKRIDDLLDTINLKEKDIKTARSDYKHSTENLNKLQNDFNDLQNENKDYAVAFAEIKKMSLFERIFNKYPNSIDALPGKVQQENIDKD